MYEKSAACFLSRDASINYSIMWYPSDIFGLDAIRPADYGGHITARE
ncbi:hypothetical protein [Anaerotruncus colihominis]|nr:hypothetical protein [Anaerotruncus colihominis]MCQ4735341.1 hypothetical protein [Anaerotruncus colihominis]